MEADSWFDFPQATKSWFTVIKTPASWRNAVFAMYGKKLIIQHQLNRCYCYCYCTMMQLLVKCQILCNIKHCKKVVFDNKWLAVSIQRLNCLGPSGDLEIVETGAETAWKLSLNWSSEIVRKSWQKIGIKFTQCFIHIDSACVDNIVKRWAILWGPARRHLSNHNLNGLCY